ncbi:kininogen-1 [Cololabis saira]|uniref:kininogen-1 n=1 Tax=Cololabis saira TaxID=129043 RepID=UPI002AD5A976|nr:kininogen-1 [Cololabis saira]XP_061594609.1 kininogen-1 [Cololabis saira]
MRSGAVLCALSLLCLQGSAIGQEPEAVQAFCDDPAVEKAVHSALHKFNEQLSSGHKLALFQILSAGKGDSGSAAVYSLKFTSRRTDCPAGSSKPWTDCDYLLSGHKEPFSCNATVHVTETESDTKEVECVLHHNIVPERAPCLGCPEEIDENSEDLRVPVTASLSRFNSDSNSTHLFTLHEIGHASRQVVAGFRFKLRFDMRKSVCAKAEHNELHELCIADIEDVEFVNCNSTVDVAPWRFELPAVQMDCEGGALPPTVFSRRRPPGWSPLRNFLYRPPSTASPTPSTPPSQAPSKATKEESSEEDLATSKKSASPTHCPSKPWKPFKPVDAALGAAPTVADSPQPSAFSDKDLLN